MAHRAAAATHTSRASVITLGVVAGIAALWVYAATRHTEAAADAEEQVAQRRRRRNRNIQPVYIDGDSGQTTLHRTRSIRRQRRQPQAQPSAGTDNSIINILETLDSTDTSDESPNGISFTRRGSRASLSAVGAHFMNEEEEAVAREMVALAAEAIETDRDSDGKSSSSEEDEDEEADEESRKMQIDIQLLQLIGTIAEDHARRSNVIHRGVICNNCKETPILGVRYKCAQCSNVDVCESCEGHGAHQEHFLLKISVPLPPLMNQNVPLIRQLFPGTVGMEEVPGQESADILESTQLSRKEIGNLYSEFRILSTKNADGVMVITRKTFYQCLGRYGGARSVLGKRLFAYYDADKDGEITFKEMAQGFYVYNTGTVEEKAPYIFRAYDVDGDGRISRDDMRAMLEAFSETSRELTRTMLRSVNAEAIGNPHELMPDQPLTGAFMASVPDGVAPGPQKEQPSMRSNLTAVSSSATPIRRAAELPGGRDRAQSRASSDSRDGEEEEEEPASDASSNAVSVAATTSATIGTVASARRTRHRQASNAAAPEAASQSSAAASASTSPGAGAADEEIGTLLRGGRQEHSSDAAVVGVQLPSALPSALPSKIVHASSKPPA
ncbi:hypothetical protein EV175_001299, partial [Coemansia sp. RSA 1933]